MNYFNHQNVQLAYEAVYNQDLCESMEELGLIDEPQELNELSIALKRRAADASVAKVKRMQDVYDKERTSYTAKYLGDKLNRAIAQHNRLVKAAYPPKRKPNTGENLKAFNQKRREKKETIAKLNRAFRNSPSEEQQESYEIYNTILEYLIQEGYADSLGSAEIILENMSEEWIEYVLSEESSAYRQRNWQPLTPQRKERIKRQMAGAYNADQRAQGQRDQKEANRQWRRGISMTFQTKMPRN